MRIPKSAIAMLCLCTLASMAAFAQTASISGCQMLPSNNIWNTPVDNLPLDPNSANYVNSTGPSSPLFPDFYTTAGMHLNIADSTTPRVPLVLPYPAEADPGPYPVPASAWIQPQSDGHMIVLDTANCKLYETWDTSANADGSFTADSAAIFDLKSNTNRPAYWTAAVAAGTPMTVSEVTYDEVMSGQITHAIGITVPYTQQAYVWPAVNWASYYNSPLYPHMGQRFRLNASFDISPYPYEVQVILTALKKYGAIVVDNGAAWFLEGQQDPRWNNDNLHMLTGVLGSNMEVVDESSLMVSPNSSVAAGSPLALDGIYLDQRQVSAGATVNAQAILTAPAPAGGVTVSLSMSSPGVIAVPGSVTVPAGAVSAAIPLTVNNIGLTTPVTIIGSYQGVTVSSPVLVVSGATGVAAPRLSTLVVTPTSTAGGTTLSATVTLTSAAVAGGTAVTLTSSNSSVLPVPATVTVPSGALSATATLNAGSASVNTAVNVTASLYGEPLTAPVTITPGTSTTTPPSTPTPPPTSGSDVVMVNAGGGAYTDPSGNAWSADSGFTGGMTASTGSAIAGTSTPALYQSCRWGYGFNYAFSLPNGSYTVTLKFAEINYNNAGARMFNVGINGTQVLTNFDIVAAAGAALTAVDKSFPIMVTNGLVDIQFTQGAADLPLVSAIEITPSGASTSTSASGTPIALVNSGGAAYTDASGNAWSADTDYNGGMVASTGAAIAGTSTPALYQSCRWGWGFNYNFTVPNGSYTVTLKFAEINYNNAGARMFNVGINGTQVLTNFDIVAAAGAALTAVDKSYPVTVTNGQIAIQFTQGAADLPLVSAIAITPSGTSTSTSASGTVVTAVNSGGAAYTDPSGTTWSADTGGLTASTTSAIAGTSTPVLYQSCRWGWGFNYNFTVPNGSYTVTLKFAEINYNNPGARMFNVAINGTQVLTNFDIVAAAGAALTAIDKSFPVTVANGQIALQFLQGAADLPLVSAIEIVQQ